MNLLMTLTFVSVSPESKYRISQDLRPLETRAGLSWITQLEPRCTVSLPDDGNLADFKCQIEVKIDEPFDGKEGDASWDYAHGLLQWVGGNEPVLIRLVVAAETFASLTQLAERGNLPSVAIRCIPGHGLENDGPYGPMRWDITNERPVPVKHIQFIYTFSGTQ
jgi:hypothetical protein